MMTPNFHPRKQEVSLFNCHILHPGSHKGLKVTWHINWIVGSEKHKWDTPNSVVPAGMVAKCYSFKEKKTSLKWQNHVIPIPQAKFQKHTGVHSDMCQLYNEDNVILSERWNCFQG